jgi:hypothetical protein
MYRCKQMVTQTTDKKKNDNIFISQELTALYGNQITQTAILRKIYRHILKYCMESVSINELMTGTIYILNK